MEADAVCGNFYPESICACIKRELIRHGDIVSCVIQFGVEITLPPCFFISVRNAAAIQSHWFSYPRSENNQG